MDELFKGQMAKNQNGKVLTT